MGSISGESSCSQVVALPYPSQGHVNSMLNLCKFLANRSADIIITVVLTEELLAPAAELPNIRFRSISNVFPPELNVSADLPGVVRAVNSNMEGPFEQVLDQLDSPAAAIFADTDLPWAVAVAERRNIPLVSLWPMSASTFSVKCHFQLLIKNGHFPADLSEHGEEIIDYIPGLYPIRLADFPTIFSRDLRQLVVETQEAFVHTVRRAKAVIFASFYELEPHVADTLKATLPFPIYFVGPLVPHTTLADTNSSKTPEETNQPDYFKWLDSQPERSVLYISMGSYLSVSREQMDEMIAGVRASGVRFLWVARNNAQQVQEACGEMGLVVPWCDQLKVLCHGSVGGFWTHCGWNSTSEAIFAGVPMLTFPIVYDQFLNRKFIVDELKVGMKVEGAKEVIKRDEIGSIVQKFMDLEGGEEGKEMRKRASELKQKCRRALAKDGSSDSDMNAFISNVLKR